MKSFHSKKGFTIVELLVVIAIMAVLALIVFASLNPKKRFMESRNAKRTSDVNSILSAIHLYLNDNGGTMPTGLTTTGTDFQLGTSGSGCTLTTGGCSAAAACINLASPLSTYIASIPIDPTGGTTYTAAKTGYAVAASATGIVTVKACGAENSVTISATR